MPEPARASASRAWRRSHEANPGRQQMGNLTNKIALVTGASRGIGKATALALAAAGAHVLVHYGKSQKDADTLVAAIRHSGGKADSVSADLAAAGAVAYARH